MNDFSVIVNDININKNQLKLDAAVACGNDCLTPKMRVIFRRGDEVRRLPLLMRGSFRRTRNNDTIVIFSYSYLINCIFTKESDEEITVGLEVSFGDECCEDVDFFVSRGVASKNPDIKIDEKYIGGSLFDGVTIYSNPFSSKKDEEEYEITYTCTPDPVNRRLVISSKSNEIKKGSLFNAFASLCRGIMVVIVMLACILLIPMFVIDGFFAALNITSQRRYIPVEGFIRNFIGQTKANVAAFLKYAFKNKPIATKIITFRERNLIRYYNRLCRKPVVENRITFISGRRDELGGNEKFVYDLIKDRKDIDFQFLMSSELDRASRSRDKKKFYNLYATSKVVIVDDYYNLLNSVEKRDDVILFQLWHACGAFKTFGFSRLGKEGGPKQTSPNHRMYDYAVVSSQSIAKYYAEGFGISDKNVLASGVPRTDIFADKEYAETVRKGFYERHPSLLGKKIVFFAPTFRGVGQKSAYYPLNVFDPVEFCNKLGNDYAVIIKLHPFCPERFEIPEDYKDRIVDLSDEDELNDLLFVTDLLITDYSSSVFEASLLNIPMLFYAYDLYQYISERDFYCDFETFVPGKIVFTQQEMEEAIAKGDFESGKIEDFRNKFFSSLDGKSSQRVADAVINALKE